jgi:hypothetical protein
MVTGRHVLAIWRDNQEGRRMYPRPSCFPSFPGPRLPQQHHLLHIRERACLQAVEIHAARQRLASVVDSRPEVMLVSRTVVLVQGGQDFLPEHVVDPQHHVARGRKVECAREKKNALRPQIPVFPSARLVPDGPKWAAPAVTRGNFQFFISLEVKLELVRGFEPRTCALRMRCSTN